MAFPHGARAGGLAERGFLVVVVGASGAGKDTAMRAARPLLPDVTFVRRTITRPREAERGRGEDHEPVSEAAFAERERDGGFAVTWDAHGLRYGIPGDVPARLRRGETALVNGSRDALGAIDAAFAPECVRVIEVTASAAIRARRLAGRGREDATAIEARLERAVDGDALARRLAEGRAVRVSNEATAQEAGRALAQAVRALARH